MKKNMIWWWVLAGILGLVLIGLIAFYINYNRMVVRPNRDKEVTNQIITPTATPTPDPLASYSILLLGYGGGTHEGGLLTDSIMLAKIDPRDQEVSLISIPRDLWVPIPINGDEYASKKINEAYAIGTDDKKYPNKKTEFTGSGGGGEMAKKVIENIVGFKIDYFASIDFDGFVKVIDILDGIDVKVTRTFDDPFYPIETNINDTCGKSDEEMKLLEATMSGEKLEQQYTCRYENLHFEKGVQHLDGITALKFARSRHSTDDGGDFNRAERQKKVVIAVRDKIINIGFIPKIIPTLQTLTRHIKTDVDISKMTELVTKIPEISEYKIISINLTDQNVLKNSVASTKQFILSPRLGENNWDDVKLFIKNKGVVIPSPTINTQN
jgi:anionic cell wall polymer biosynthesis LytR-Cps2A-Psr (LCP) family protein